MVLDQKLVFLDETGHPWIAKFPSAHDEINIGRWEYLAHKLALQAGITMVEAQVKIFKGSMTPF